ncbi:MAG TPA: thioredoxin domain-containing protein [Hyphomonadaceae bacterium]|nr:thioredoxin domain-containing protein [Hyphomonadaceae bacterium]
MRRLPVLAALGLLAACDPPRAAEPYKTVAITPFLGSPVLGDPKSPVEIVEYASTTCGHCYAFHHQVFPQLKAKYMDTGKAHLEWRVMPTPPEAVSEAGAAIARCAGEDKFFDTIADLFGSQDAILKSAVDPWKLQQQFRALGARHGLSADQVGTCIDDKSIAAMTSKVAHAAPDYVTGTPTIVVNGEKIPEHSLEAVSAAIDAALAKTPPAAAANPT